MSRVEQIGIDILDEMPEYCNVESGSQRILWGEPVLRRDGTTLNVVIEQYKDSQRVSFEIDGVCAGYSRKEVLAIGSGDFDKGIERISQVVYTRGNKAGVLKPFVTTHRTNSSNF